MVEIIHHGTVYGGQSQFLRVQNLNPFPIFLQKCQCSFGQRPGFPLRKLQNKGNLPVRNLKRSMEIFPGMNGIGMNPLHLHKNADALHISRPIPCSASDGIDHTVIFILLRKGFRPPSHQFTGLLHNQIDLGYTVHELVIILISFCLLQDFHRQKKPLHGFLLPDVFVLSKTVFHHIIRKFRNRGLRNPGKGNDCGSSFLSQLGCFYSLRSISFMGSQDQNRIFPETFGNIMYKLIAVVPSRFQLYPFCLQKYLSRIKSPQGTTAGHKIDLPDSSCLLLRL